MGKNTEKIAELFALLRQFDNTKHTGVIALTDMLVEGYTDKHGNSWRDAKVATTTWISSAIQDEKKFLEHTLKTLESRSKLFSDPELLGIIDQLITLIKRLIKNL